MSLPYPHGSAAGQIAHNAFYDTGYTPGSTLGKFIGFGEEGTSNIANRAHWALSANIDYTYQILALNRSIPRSVSFTASGSPGQNMYQFADDVFTGDSTYPGISGSSDPVGMRLLFAVLDSQFNILLDSSGNEVRVKRIRETTGATDIYKTGFATNPRIYFCTVNSAGTEVNPTYQIPNGTNVILIYPHRHSIEGGVGDPLPTDAFSRFGIMGAATTGAAFLIDGSRSMKGNSDWGGYDFNNVSNIVGSPTYELTLQSLMDLWLADVQIPGGVKLSQPGVTDLRMNTPYTSLIGELNSKTYANEGLHANRCVSRGGPIYFQASPPFAGRILFSAGTVVMLNGEAVDIGGRSIYANNGPTECCILNSSGALALVAPSAVTDQDVLLTYHNWNGTVFNPAIDCLWTLDKETGNFEITCSTTVPGVNTTSLSEAAIVATMHNLISKANLANSQIARPCVIRIKGDLYTPYGCSQNPGQELFVVGDGPDNSKIYTDGGGTAIYDLFSCNGSTLHLKGLSIIWNEATDQGALYSCVSDPGAFSTIENCHFYGATNKWYSIIKSTTSYARDRRLEIRNCWLENWQGYAVDTGGIGNTLVEGSLISGYGTAVCRFGSRSCLRDSMIYTNSSTNGILFLPNASISPFDIHGLDVYDCIFDNAANAFYYYATTGGKNMRVNFRNNSFKDCLIGAYVYGYASGIGTQSTFTFEGNNIWNTGGSAAVFQFEHAQNVYILNNHMASMSGTAYAARYTTATQFIGNYVEGFETGPFGIGNVCVSANDTMVGPTIIANNTLLSAGSTAGRVNIGVGGHALIYGNKIEGSSTVTHGISANYYDINNAVRIIGNDISLHTTACIDVRGYAVTDHLNNGPVVMGNTVCLDSGSSTVAAIYLDTVPGVSVIGNTIGSWDGMKGGGLYLAPASSIGGVVIGCDGASVIGNTFWKVRGFGPAYGDPTPRLAVCDLSNGNTRAVSCIGNTFNECGEFTGSGVPNGTYQDILYCEAFDSTIQGNTFWQCPGIQNSTCLMSHIRSIGWRTTIIGNHIRYAMIAATPPYDTYTTGTMYGILDASWKSVVIGNNIAFGGSIVSGGPAAVIGIQLTSACTSSVVVGNRTSVWDVTGAGAYAIHVNASEVVVVGNMAEAHDIWTVGASCILNSNFCAGHDAGGTGRVQCLSGGSSMCLGNVSLGTGGTNPGTAATAGNI